MSEQLQSEMALMECSSLDITAMISAPKRAEPWEGLCPECPFLLLCFLLLAAIVFDCVFPVYERIAVFLV